MNHIDSKATLCNIRQQALRSLRLYVCSLHDEEYTDCHQHHIRRTVLPEHLKQLGRLLIGVLLGHSAIARVGDNESRGVEHCAYRNSLCRAESVATTHQMTQEQVADKLGISAQSVSRWETNATFPDILLLPEIARLYDVLVDDLFRENLQEHGKLFYRPLSDFG